MSQSSTQWSACFLCALYPAARRAPILASALAVFGIGSGAILGAWGLELIGGYVPCELCLTQRVPYYVGLPIAAAVAFAACRGLPSTPLRIGLLLVAAAMLTTAGYAAYHTGVELHWWPGPTDCSGGLAGGLPPLSANDDLMEKMRSTRLVRCDEPALVIFGLSLAAWNVAVSTGLAVVAAWGALAKPLRA